MAVISYREVLPRTLQHRFGESPTAETRWIATVDAPGQHQAVIDAIGIVHGSQHPEYPFLRMLEASVTEPDRHHVEVTYRYEVPQQPDFQPNPLARPDVWQFSTQASQVPFLFYYHGTANNDIRPLVNAAGDFIEGLTVNAPEVRATISGNRASFPLSVAAELTNSINNAPYLGGPAYSWLCNGISGQQTVEVVNDVEIKYWQVSVELTYRRGGYVEQIPHVGFHFLENNFKKRVYVREDGTGDKISASAPQPLNESGGLKYPDGEGDGRPDLILRRPYPAVNFAQYFGTPPF